MSREVAILATEPERKAVVTLSEELRRLRESVHRRVKKRGKKAFERAGDFLVAQSRVPERPVYDSQLFPWTRLLEANWKTIRDELGRVLRLRDDLPRLYEISPDNYRVSSDNRWKTFALRGFGYWAALGRQLCPETTQLLARVPRLESAFFSVLDPGARIPLHRGIPKGLLRCHLGLVVPEQRERCQMILDGVPHSWQEGRTLVFDDTYYHEVHNDTDQERIVLLLDFERPMHWRGRLVNRTLLAFMRRTRHVRGPRRAVRAWEKRVRRKLP